MVALVMARSVWVPDAWAAVGLPGLMVWGLALIALTIGAGFALERVLAHPTGRRVARVLGPLLAFVIWTTYEQGWWSGWSFWF